MERKTKRTERKKDRKRAKRKDRQFVPGIVQDQAEVMPLEERETEMVESLMVSQGMEVLMKNGEDYPFLARAMVMALLEALV